MLRRTLFALFLLLIPAAAPAAQIFVNAEGTAQYATIQAALDAAVDGDEIVLADGVYTGPGNRRLQFYDDVTLTGYSDYHHCILDCEGSAADPHYGFALTEETGGTIRNLTVRGAWWSSGAVAQTGWGEYRFEACRFEYNTAGGDGGVLRATDLSDVTFADCVFYRNEAAADGGAIFATQGSTIALEGCSLVLNGSVRGACAFAEDDASLHATNCLLAWSWKGSAVYDYYAGGLRFDCCDLYGNRDGDWTNGASTAGGTGNLNVDPLLLDPMAGSDGLYLSQASPVSAAANACGRIGAFMRVYTPQAIHGVAADSTGMYASIRDALAELPAGSEIVLEDGTYRGPGARSLYSYRSSIAIRSRSDDPAACVIDVADQYASGFLTYLADGGSSLLRGLTFVSQPEESLPSEILQRWTEQDLHIENCRFTGSLYGSRGMIRIENRGDLSLVDCEFSGNSCANHFGDGLLVVHGDSTTIDDTVSITTCTFADNVADYEGAVLAIESHTVLIDDCLFDGNHVGLEWFSGGNIASLSGCRVDLRNTLFADNACEGSGALNLFDCTGLLENVRFEANESLNHGGGLCAGGGDLLLRQCHFFDNVAGGSGGGAYVGTFSSEAPVAVVEFDSCLFLGNRSRSRGSGLVAASQVIGMPGEVLPDISTEVTVHQCTFHHNESTDGDAQLEGVEGGLMIAGDLELLVEYTLITNSNEGQGLAADGIRHLNVTGCNIRGNRGGNYVGQAAAWLQEEGNYSEIPYYCSLDDRYLPVNEISICNPENNVLATQIGVFGVGCYGVSGVDEAPTVPEVDRLQGNHPNPFNPATTLSFELAQSGPVTLRIHDVKGRLVRVLVDGEVRQAGPHRVRWDGRDQAQQPAAAGLYFARLITREADQTHKMVLLK